jgi:nucleotide-binding universal stress UspA family protein
MAKLFSKILCPVDFDENSMAALDYAIKIASESEAKLYLMYVVFVPLARPGFPLEPAPVVSEEPSKMELEKLARARIAGRVPHEVVVRIGQPAPAIIEAAETLGVDLVVMATHGRTGVARFFLGSVAERVVRESTRPVLTVRPTGAAAEKVAAAAS